MMAGNVREINSVNFRLTVKSIATHTQITALALKCLSMLVRDDFDLVLPVLPRILVRVLQVRCFRIFALWPFDLNIFPSDSRIS